jgi:hypothetical protein
MSAWQAGCRWGYRRRCHYVDGGGYSGGGGNSGGGVDGGGYSGVGRYSGWWWWMVVYGDSGWWWISWYLWNLKFQVLARRGRTEGGEGDYSYPNYSYQHYY